MNKKKGDKTEDGSYYKIDLKDIKSINVDSEIVQQFDKLSRYKTANENLINNYNHLNKIRVVAATIPDEYIRINLDRLVSVDDTRRLIIKGCEAEMEEINEQLTKMTELFNKQQI